MTATATAPSSAAPVSTLAWRRFVRDVHALVRDLAVPDMKRYWVDFLATIGVAYSALALYLSSDLVSLTGILSLVVCGLATFRAVAFTHELTHRQSGAFRTFAVVWNVICGIPLLVPSFMYGDHKGHHATQVYGTWADPEYLVRGARSRTRMVLFLLLPVIYPLLPVVRFLLLTPLAALSGRADRLVWTYGSSLYVMNESYRRTYDAAAMSGSRWAQELACAAWAWALTLLVASQQIPWTTVGKVYLVFLFWIGVNQVRTLVAHRYDSDPETAMSYLKQLLDTNTFPHGTLLPNLWAPLGLRYHALHHLLPSMPYHAMAEAHRRLVEQLPPGSAYHQTLRPGLWPVLVSMLRASN